MMLRFVLITCLVACSWSLKHEKCKSDGKARISHLKVTPDPIKLSAGQFTISVDAALNSVLSGKIEAHTSIKKKMGFIWVKVHCKDGVGSCKYDVCSELGKLNTPYKCPLPAKTLSFKDLKMEIPSLSSSVKSLITGDIWAKVEIKENGKTIACEEVTITVKK